MGDGKHCPACGKEIGVWPVFSAAMPSWIRCPHCKSRLRYRKTAGVFAIVLVGLLGLMIVTFIRVSALTTPRRGQIGASVALASCVLAELATVWFLRNRRELELADRPRQELPIEGSGDAVDQAR
jgi:DNA-directed RNA polymerase subunit RPC12/RpoP